MQQSWTSGVYGFFDKNAVMGKLEGRPYLEFRCLASVCRASGGQHIRRFLDTKDKGSTGNLSRYAERCWGEQVVKDAKKSDIESVRKAVSTQRDGTITAAFKAKGHGVVTYSNSPLTKADVRYVFNGSSTL